MRTNMKEDETQYCKRYERTICDGTTATTDNRFKQGPKQKCKALHKFTAHPFHDYDSECSVQYIFCNFKSRLIKC